MDQKIKISVIIPNYNYGQYIFKCVHSVIESDFNKNNIEIIIIDDASTDDSVKVVSSIIEKEDFPITLHQNKSNLGLAKTRNKGINLAKGDYLFFLDSDNYIGKTCLKDHYDFLVKHQAYSACYAPIQKFDSVSNKLLDVFSDEQFNFEKLKYGNYIDAMSMIRKDIFSELGGYDENIPINGWEDYELWLRLGSNKKKVTILSQEPLSYYRVHENSMASTFTISSISVLSNYIDEKYGIATRKNDIEKQHILNPLNKIMMQVFYASKNDHFTEKKSLSQSVKLEKTPNTYSFILDNNYDKFRFDLGNEIGTINIHNIVFKSINDDTLYVWDKKNLSHKLNLFLIKNEDIESDFLIQLSYLDDPQFSFSIPIDTYKKNEVGIKIDITLSQTSLNELDALNTLGYLSSSSEFKELKATKKQLTLELNNSNVTLNETSKKLNNLNSLLSKSDLLISQLTSDKSFLANELQNKNEVITKIFTEKEKIEISVKQIIEENKKTQNELLYLLKNEQEKLNKQNEDIVITKTNLNQVNINVSELKLQLNSYENENKSLAIEVTNKTKYNKELENILQQTQANLEEKVIDLENYKLLTEDLKTKILELENKGIFKLIFEKRNHK